MERKKILIVEDDFSARRVLGFNLKQQGYQVIETEDGISGFEAACTELPDLILLDIMMPGVNGFEVCRKIRATPDLAEVPIIFLTARAGMADKKFGLKAGADDYLTKPIDLNELNERVAEHLKQAETTQTHVEPAHPGQIIALFSPKEEMGVTTLAIKLSEAVTQEKQQPVVLIDLVLPFGEIASTLNLVADKSVSELLSRPMSEITIDTIEQYMQQHLDGFQVIPAPAIPTGPEQKPIPTNLKQVLDLLVEAGYLVILDVGSTLTPLTVAALHYAGKIFTLTSGQSLDNEAFDKFLKTARRLGLEIPRFLPVINQLYGPVENEVVLARSPVARVPYADSQSDQMTWTQELAFKKLIDIMYEK
jgi:DNA-binding response OmpR family regulator